MWITISVRFSFGHSATLTALAWATFGEKKRIILSGVCVCVCVCVWVRVRAHTRTHALLPSRTGRPVIHALARTLCTHTFGWKFLKLRKSKLFCQHLSSTEWPCTMSFRWLKHADAVRSNSKGQTVETSATCIRIVHVSVNVRSLCPFRLSRLRFFPFEGHFGYSEVNFLLILLQKKS